MKKHLPKLALSLVLGTLLNVAVTWGWAAATTFKSQAYAELHAPLGDSYHWWVIRWDQVGGTRIMSRCWQDSAPEPFTDGDPGQLLAGWGRIVPPDPHAPVIRSQIDEGWGFPARSFSCHIEVGATTTRRGILQVRPPDGPGRAGLYLPVAVIWPGLALNSLFYAVISMIALALVRDGRAALQRRADRRSAAVAQSPATAAGS